MAGHRNLDRVLGAVTALAPGALIDSIEVDEQGVRIHTPTPGEVIGRRGATLDQIREAARRVSDNEHLTVEVIDRSRDRDPTRAASCSFCAQRASRSRRLFAGPGVFVCSECVDRFGRTSGSQPATGPDALRVMDDDDLLTELRRADAILRPVQDHIESAVRVLRERGISWATVGAALGMSRQGAWARFSGED